MNYSKTGKSFLSDGVECVAWYYKPNTEMPLPIIVMAHGLGGTKEMRLDVYAESFAEAGFACFLFDYRNFGESKGKDRQNINAKLQLEDWNAAINFTKTLDGIDANRIGIFGSSFSGGHVITLSAERQDIKAVIAQCPFTSGIASGMKLNLFSAFKISILSIADLISQLLGLKPILVDLGGPPGSTSLMPVADYKGYYSLVPEETNFKRKVWARTAFQVLCYEPKNKIKHIDCPIYFAICEKDSVAPPNVTSKYAKNAKKSIIKHYPYGHFEIYLGEAFHNVITDYVKFYKENLIA
ncbi:alpha/beta hydrolase [Chryseobacterium tongliaoense]|uniref:alpha/beta hydrolase n=1 Tax=Chryseobacterium tongliaoense TaxID=3240933 RepID=UPI003511DF97